MAHFRQDVYLMRERKTKSFKKLAAQNNVIKQIQHKHSKSNAIQRTGLSKKWINTRQHCKNVVLKFALRAKTMTPTYVKAGKNFFRASMSTVIENIILKNERSSDESVLKKRSSKIQTCISLLIFVLQWDIGSGQPWKPF